jgi:hypothetical protein
MPTDEAARTVHVVAPPDEVLVTIRAVEHQSEWVPEIRTSEVLERDDEGRPALARFTASTPVGTDEYTLSYRHRPDGMAWSLVKGKLQTGQEADYAVVASPGGGSDVTFSLSISHNLPLPGFLRRKVITGLVQSTTDGLAKRVGS